jgi:hypothetical protein
MPDSSFDGVLPTNSSPTSSATSPKTFRQRLKNRKTSSARGCDGVSCRCIWACAFIIERATSWVVPARILTMTRTRLVTCLAVPRCVVVLAPKYLPRRRRRRCSLTRSRGTRSALRTQRTRVAQPGTHGQRTEKTLWLSRLDNEPAPSRLVLRPHASGAGRRSAPNYAA